jgi:hypothetical protein
MSEYIKKKEKKKAGLGPLGRAKKKTELGEIMTKDGKNILIIDPKMFNKDGTMNFAKGGRAGFKAGSKGCKLAKKGRGRAYGKNS